RAKADSFAVAFVLGFVSHSVSVPRSRRPNKCSIGVVLGSVDVFLLALAAVTVGLAQPPAWIQRVVQGPYVTWRAADVLGTPVVEGIVVNRDAVSHSLVVNVVDSRFNPPRIVKLRELRGSGARWLRAGRRDGLARNEIAVDV